MLQIVAGIKADINDGSLRAGSKAPSIRQFAHARIRDFLSNSGRRWPPLAAELPGHGPNFSFDSMG